MNSISYVLFSYMKWETITSASESDGIDPNDPVAELAEWVWIDDSKAEKPDENNQALSLSSVEAPSGSSQQYSRLPDSVYYKIFRVFNTSCQWLWGEKLQLCESFQEETSLTRLTHTWEMLSSSLVEKYIHSLTQNYSLHTLHEFYLGCNGINTYSLEKIQEIILESSSEYCNSEVPVCIPVVFSKQELFGRNHIAVILIKDNKVEYFDPLGITSHERSLTSENESLYHVLEFCQKHFHATEIIENTIPLQKDCHNCGVFVCHFLYRRFVEECLVGAHLCAISHLQLYQFREKIATSVAPIFKALREPIESIESMDEVF